jgi:hypothetical protein
VNIPLWVAKAADSFWSKAGCFEAFPRRLVGPIANAVPLTLVYPPRLTIDAMLAWLRENGVACSYANPSRGLRACLYARYGNGFAFIDGADSENEQRFSVAHELAHFLRDYLEPRRRIEKSLGPAALDVLDGLRAPTNKERLHALLAATPIGYHVHLMERDCHGGTSSVISDAETSADRLAYELLAPAEHVLRTSYSGDLKDRAVVQHLIQSYGFPERQASEYARVLCPPTRRRDPLLRHIAESSR